MRITACVVKSKIAGQHAQVEIVVGDGASDVQSKPGWPPGECPKMQDAQPSKAAASRATRRVLAHVSANALRLPRLPRPVTAEPLDGVAKSGRFS